MVLSIVWTICGGFWVSGEDVKGRGALVLATYGSCEGSNSDFAACDRAFASDWPKAMRGHWSTVAAVTLIPIPLGWLLVYGLIALWRWIAWGFKTRE